MKKIGICTLYYKNRNYGANLQAYALRKVLESLGNEAELITYYNNTKLHFLLSAVKQKMKKKSCIAAGIATRNVAVDQFNQEIPHSKLYYSNTIDSANSEYDCFIAGSDQVWNPDWINRYTALEFVNSDKRTASYAASTGRICLNDLQQRKLKSALENTQYISIREKASVPALQMLTDKKITYVLDPTMLLSAKEWNTICSNRLIQEDYLFCYFLGDNENLRKVAREYAVIKNLKLVTLPFLNASYRKVDDGFGDYALYDISPKDFLSLIKYASFVLTDSFHAAVFSHIYEKPFAASGRKENEMDCRLESLTNLFGTFNRYFVDHIFVSVEKLETLSDALDLNWEAYKAMRQSSLEFLTKVVAEDGE